MEYQYQRLNETNLFSIFEFLGLHSSSSINECHLYYLNSINHNSNKEELSRPLFQLLSPYHLSKEEINKINNFLTSSINDNLIQLSQLFSNSLFSTKDKTNIINAALLNNSNSYYNLYFNLDVLELDNWDDLILYRRVLNSLLYFSYCREIKKFTPSFSIFTNYISINQYSEQSDKIDTLIESSKENYFNYIKSLLFKVLDNAFESYNKEIEKLISNISHELYIYSLSSSRSYTVNLCFNYLYNFIQDISEELSNIVQIEDYLADFLLDDLYSRETFINIDTLDYILKENFTTNFTPKQIYYLFKEYFIDKYNIKDKLISLRVEYSV